LIIQANAQRSGWLERRATTKEATRDELEKKENIVSEENGKINLFVLAVNIKSIAFRSNSSRRLFTFIPIPGSEHDRRECYWQKPVSARGDETSESQPPYQWLSMAQAASHSMRNIAINFPLKRNLFSFLCTHRARLSYSAAPDECLKGRAKHSTIHFGLFFALSG
jgi:hypothetical protein